MTQNRTTIKPESLEQQTNEIVETVRQARRYQHIRAHGQWRRGEDYQGEYTELVLRLPARADLSCNGMIDHNIDLDMEKHNNEN